MRIKVIGDGGYVYAYAVTNKAVLYSNNMRDIRFYSKKYNLEYLTAADIFIYYRTMVMDYEIEKCWALKKHSYLPGNIFLIIMKIKVQRDKYISLYFAFYNFY